ncbi:hypothetical protein [Bradyrhizobium sp. JYMT SZCCT0180]|uniref:hypothetical protein n=1 Tax=Bradyrhizobium sp. JYMT SZCCT0180 TaxID=2807666 RepID=UPI001BADC005|nr:hypothetical protein [Bradyrhizobium sp. JYMT SZCCT0180]MBR1214603.1 hypothetical protein [Bradyrhizobium sp. JYMT SZCCT0180]
MKLYDRFGAKGFHSSLITTFGIDFDTYENVCLNRLRGAGCTNNLILPDTGMLSYALNGASALPRYAGRLYSATGISASRGGVFHSKVFLRLGRRSGELLVGSANMTAPGLAGNRELMGMVECDREESGERRIIAAAWLYLVSRLDQTSKAIAQQIAWMQARTPWLMDTEPATGLTVLRDGSGSAFVTSGNQTGIAQQFIDLVGKQPVARLIVMSPYWDQSLAALKYLIMALAPQETILLIEPKRGLFPTNALKDLPDIKLMDISALDPTRFFHAKVIIAQTQQADHVLFGSGNCTIAALGNASSVGTNDEACLYRRLPPQASIKTLKIEDLIISSAEIDRSQIKPLEFEDDLKLSELRQRNPGRFECVYDMLIWWPPANVDDDSTIELLDADGNLVQSTLTLVHTEPAERRFRLTSMNERPALARLRYPDGKLSNPSIVALTDALKQTAKEARGKKAEGAASLLAEETNEGFWLLEALDVLEAAEQRQADDTKTISRKRQNADKPTPPQGQYRTLDYERFIAGRHLRSDGSAMAPSSLTGSELSLVRGFLNRILGMDRPDETPADLIKDEELAGAFDMGDETADPQGALEGGEEFPKRPSKRLDDNDEETKKERLRRERRKAHAGQIIAAIRSFGERIRMRAAAGQLSGIDVLRLRALITVVAAAGHSDTLSARKPDQSTLQTFPSAGDVNSWPRLLGRVLFVFFGGSRPAIRDLHLDASFDELTADIKESWATCFWTIQVCLDAVRKHRENTTFVKSLQSLARRLYAVTQLQEIELAGPEIMGVINAMSQRYAKRLGFDPERIESAHISEIRSLLTQRISRP